MDLGRHPCDPCLRPHVHRVLLPMPMLPLSLLRLRPRLRLRLRLRLRVRLAEGAYKAALLAAEVARMRARQSGDVAAALLQSLNAVLESGSASSGAGSSGATDQQRVQASLSQCPGDGCDGGLDFNCTTFRVDLPYPNLTTRGNELGFTPMPHVHGCAVQSDSMFERAHASAGSMSSGLRNDGTLWRACCRSFANVYASRKWYCSAGMLA